MVKAACLACLIISFFPRSALFCLLVFPVIMGCFVDGTLDMPLPPAKCMHYSY